MENKAKPPATAVLTVFMNGILVIDKPESFTSHDVVGKVRKILKTKAVGHTGTLDPFATGVLVVLIGKATRLAQFLDKAEKEYLATIQFGFETGTGDRTGSPRSKVQSPKSFSIEEVEKVLADFRGEIWQTPPMFSAKKIAGKKLYELARRGEEIERQPIKIKISELEITEDFETLRTPHSALRIRTVCSAGTYIRVLAEDIGKALGVGAHLAELRRTRAGAFDLRQAVTLNGLDKLANENQLGKVLISPNEALAHLPFVVLNENAVRKTLNGMKLFVSLDFENGQFVRMCDERENLIAVGIFDETGNAIQPRVVLAEK